MFVMKINDTWQRAYSANPIESLDGETRAPLQTILSTSWTPEERIAYGVYEVGINPPDEYHRFTGDFDEEEGIPVAVFEEIPLEELKQQVKRQIDEKFYQIMDQGYQHNFGTEMEPDYGVLQTRRNSEDQTNWLTLKDTCNEAIAAGYGEAPCLIPIKTEDNRKWVLSFNETAQVLRDMKTWGGYVLGMSWVLKDLLETVSDIAGLEMVKSLIDIGVTDIENGLYGWPIHN